MWTIKGSPTPYKMQHRTIDPSEPRTTYADLLLMVYRVRDQVDALELEVRSLTKRIRIAFGLCTLLALAGLLGLI